MKPTKLIFTFLLLGSLLMAALAFLYLYPDVSALSKQYPHLMPQARGVAYEMKESLPRHWVPLAEISQHARWAIVLSEDWAFYQHQGLDLEQIKLALNEMAEGERFRGASTISQQTVKNIFLSPKKTFWRKFHETLLTLRLERHVKKDRILEIYLNSIEYGPGIYGIKQAASHYFQKHPSELSAREGAFLAMMLPSPVKYYTSFKRKQLSDFASGRIRSILQKMRQAKVITPESYEHELEQRFSWEKSDDVPETFVGDGGGDVGEVE
jgi:monofunctional glycosyltransferase